MMQLHAPHWAAGMDRFTWGVGLGALLLCVLAIGSIFIVRTTPPPPLSTPEGVVSAFVQAVRDRDADRAWGLLTPDAVVGSVLPPVGVGGTPRDAFRREMASLPQAQTGARSVRVRGTSQQGDGVRVIVEVAAMTGGPPIFAGAYGRTVTFHLIQVDGTWRIDSAPPLYEIG